MNIGPMNARTTTDFNRVGLVKQRTAKKNAFLAVALSVIAATISFACHAITFFTDRATWEAAIQTFADVNIAGQLANFRTLPAGNPLYHQLQKPLIAPVEGHEHFRSNLSVGRRIWPVQAASLGPNRSGQRHEDIRRGRHWPKPPEPAHLRGSLEHLLRRHNRLICPQVQ